MRVRREIVVVLVGLAAGCAQPDEGGVTFDTGSTLTDQATGAAGTSGDEGKECTPGYSPCLRPASDYDCAGGSGDGPKYVSGTVVVTGSDPYGLDADNDGVGCE